MERTIGIGLLGAGTVGGTLVRRLVGESEAIAAKTGLRFDVRKIGVRDLDRERDFPISDGLLTVDFADLRPVIPNASTSCGHLSLIAQLNGTAFQFGEVDRVTSRIDGSCDMFFNWLQTDCQTYARP